MSQREDGAGGALTHFETQAVQVEWEGSLLSAGTETHRFRDGSTHVHDKVWHPGAVAIVAYDEQHVWLVRQPRPGAALQSSLEIPAGKCDREGEPPLDLARRELVEEIGKHASQWRLIKGVYPSPAISDEHLTLFVATGLSDVEGGPAPDEDEYLEVVPWPLSDVGGAIEETSDAKTLIGLFWLSRELQL